MGFFIADKKITAGFYTDPYITPRELRSFSVNKLISQLVAVIKSILPLVCYLERRVDVWDIITDTYIVRQTGVHGGMTTQNDAMEANSAGTR